MPAATSHGSLTRSAHGSNMPAPTITALRDALPVSVRETMLRLARIPATQLDLQRQLIRSRLTAGTPSDDGCSATCGSTCCD